MNKPTPITVSALLFLAGLQTHAQVRQDNRFDYGRYNTPTTQTFQRELQLRNALVTGNAPGGFSFRGDVGYTSSREFRGTLASDDLFAFRRDSVASGVSGLGIRGTEALQHQFGLTTGTRVNPNLASSFTFTRGSTFQAVRGVRSFDPTTTALNRSARPALGSNSNINNAITAPRPTSSGLTPTAGTTNQPDAVAGLWTLRSTSGYLTTRPLAGRILTQRQREDGRVATITASPLTGIEFLYDDPAPAPDPATNAPSRIDTSVESRSVLAQRIDTSFQATVQIPTVPGESEQESTDLPNGPVLNPFLTFLSQSDQPEPQTQEPTPNGRPDLGFGSSPRIDRPTAEELDAQESGTPLREDARDRMLRQLEELGVSEETLRVMREQRLEIDTLVPPEQRAPKDLYQIHMQTGERLLSLKRYFEAEARYTMALAEQPNDPVAAAGRVHAAMGAGLYVSAATNLRILLSEQPQLIPVRYGRGLLPDAARIKRIVEDLTDLSSIRSGQTEETSALPLLLAYIGYQTNDPTAMRVGIERMTAPTDQRLALLLQLIWLDQTPAEEAIKAVGEDTNRP